MDLMKEDSCPICGLIEKKSLRQLDFLLYENVNDHGVRSDFLASNGFCMHHASMMQSLGDPLGHAILYEILLQKMLNELDNCTLNHFQDGCALCDSERLIESNIMKSFMIMFKEDEFIQKYQEKGLLCIYHLNKIRMNHYKDASCNLSKLIDISLKKYKTLLSELSEIKRKSDYRFSDEMWTENEKIAWKKVVQLTIDQGKHRR